MLGSALRCPSGPERPSSTRSGSPARLVASTLLATFTLLVTPAQLAAAAPLTAPTAANAAKAPSGGPVVLLATAGLRWQDIGGSTPALYAALSLDATGSLAVRSVRDATCPVDGWLTVSAGRRAADVVTPPVGARDLSGCRIPEAATHPSGGPATVPGWGAYRAQAAADGFDADPGLLGSTLAAAGAARAAIGPGALIATADRQGHSPRAWPGLATGPGGTIDPGQDAVALSEQVTAAISAGTRLVAVDLGAVRDPGESATDDGSGPITRAQQVAAVDTRLGLILDRLPATATVITASLADDGGPPALQAVFAAGQDVAGNAFRPGLLRTSSTRQDGLIQSTDLLPTLVAALGLEIPSTAVGAPIGQVDAGGELDRLQHGLDLDEASLAVQRLTVPFFVWYGAVVLLTVSVLAVVAVRTRHRLRIRRRVLVGLQAAGAGAALVPVGTFVANLWPWWRLSPGWPALVVAAVTVAAVLAGLSFAGPWRRPLLGVAGIASALTVAVLTADLAAGSRLELVALIGGQPLVAGRFYGLSNPAFALFATAALIAALALAEGMLARGHTPRRAGLAVAAVGILATVIDVMPCLGSDVGGPPALVPAFGLLALRVAGLQLTRWRLAAMIGATVGILSAVAVLDWSRPPGQRSHLGRFVQSVLDGESATIVMRKAEQNLGLLLSSPLALSVPVVAALIAGLLWRPDRWRLTALRLAYDRQPLLPAGLVALGVLLMLGLLVNDTGVSVPPASLLILAPLLVAICAHAVELDDADRLQRALAAARRPAKR